jgi:fumarate reductase subunit D
MWFHHGFYWQNGLMIALSFNADSVKNYSLIAMGGSFIGLLLVLKFAKSIVSKLLLLIICVVIGVLAFTRKHRLVHRLKPLARSSVRRFHFQELASSRDQQLPRTH